MRATWIGCALVAVAAACNAVTGASQLDVGAAGHGGSGASGGTSPHSTSTTATTTTGTTSTTATTTTGTTSSSGVGGSGLTGGSGPGGAGGAPLTHLCPPTGDQDCSPSPNPGADDSCPNLVPQAADSCFIAAVKGAVTGTINDNPSWFGVEPQHNCQLILDLDVFLNEVVARLLAQNLCAERDPNAPFQEITVKYNNDFSEQFAIVASWGCPRYGDNIYRGCNVPAWW